MLIRDLEPGDLAAVHAINQAEVPAVGDETLPALTRIAEMSAIKLVAESTARESDGGSDHETQRSIAGFCLVLPPGTAYESGNYLWFSDHFGDFLYLDRVAISPRHQRQGVGRAMYQAVIDRAVMVRPSAPILTLEVNLEPRNDTSLAFHAALGFLEVGQRVTAYGTTVSLMALPLTGADNEHD